MIAVSRLLSNFTLRVHCRLFSGQCFLGKGKTSRCFPPSKIAS
uniref:Uncharacterized protein n=1 Tax=Anguilla anguilla TaxID=7936 RepID=A0A0E9QQU3_ANGAN